MPRASTRSSSAVAVDDRRELLGLRADERREVAEDPRHLVALGDLGLAQPVRVLDGRERLHEERLARAGASRGRSPARARAPTPSAPAPAGPPRSVTKSSWRCSRRRGVARELPEPLGEPPAALAQLPPQAAQCRRGRVAQIRAVLLDAPADLLRDRDQRQVDARHELRQGRQVVPAGERPSRGDAGAIVRATCISAACRACRRARRARPPRARRRRRRDRARPPRRGARSPRSSAAAAAARRPASADGTSAAASAAPGSLAAAPARRARTAGSSSSSRSCSRMARVYGRRGLSPASPSPTIRRHALPELRCRSSRATFSSPTAGMETTLIFHDGLELPASPPSRCSRHEEGRAALTRYYEPYLDVARATRRGLRARDADLAGEPGLGRAARLRRATALDAANRRAVAFVAAIARRRRSSRGADGAQRRVRAARRRLRARRA